MAKVCVGFRLTESQIKFLSSLGEGNKTLGLDLALVQCGHVEGNSITKIEVTKKELLERIEKLEQVRR